MAVMSQQAGSAEIGRIVEILIVSDVRLSTQKLTFQANK